MHGGLLTSTHRTPSPPEEGHSPTPLRLDSCGWPTPQLLNADLSYGRLTGGPIEELCCRHPRSCTCEHTQGFVPREFASASSEKRWETAIAGRWRSQSCVSYISDHIYLPVLRVRDYRCSSIVYYRSLIRIRFLWWVNRRGGGVRKAIILEIAGIHVVNLRSCGGSADWPPFRVACSTLFT